MILSELARKRYFRVTVFERLKDKTLFDDTVHSSKNEEELRAEYAERFNVRMADVFVQQTGRD